MDGAQHGRRRGVEALRHERGRRGAAGGVLGDDTRELRPVESEQAQLAGCTDGGGPTTPGEGSDLTKAIRAPEVSHRGAMWPAG
jgi:hypothetical protein